MKNLNLLKISLLTNSVASVAFDLVNNLDSVTNLYPVDSSVKAADFTKSKFHMVTPCCAWNDFIGWRGRGEGEEVVGSGSTDRQAVCPDLTQSRQT